MKDIIKKLGQCAKKITEIIQNSKDIALCVDLDELRDNIHEAKDKLNEKVKDENRND
jgi:hypothetical protein